MRYWREWLRRPCVTPPPPPLLPPLPRPLQAWWSESIRLLGDFHFLDRLLGYDKDGMPDEMAAQVGMGIRSGVRGRGGEEADLRTKSSPLLLPP